ncbi:MULTISPECIES: LPD38 domain-containing protein [Bacteroides]|jgi:N12 class adenine-specific DNA methylase|uniref:LPD38 domain-containing protein n=1 Tax=Bacteroides TaxID=816 RepID=UPI00189E3718|nr:LPD38 domain-containing protein [Bacteroides thetaiotaomicron]UVY25335.1 MAG: ddrB-like ParB superfamily domain protein [Bacteriophage sp.]MCS2601733.1 helicase-related protein [Bacteroides thetaiotaomicron]MDC2129296.1 helicase-related protein [Bacteroides thetaiotaomicron]MDC2134074.1 helicase-related protein [Bacteroides thetaiotaomicron]MDC2139024.1 helicase-related protein [Bacteroides thetaiotaomicron]
MPENEDKIKKLYDTFVSDGYDMESEEDFRKNLSDSTKRKAAYDALVKEGYEMEPFEEFENNIGFGKIQTPVPEPAVQTEQAWQPTEQEKAEMIASTNRMMQNVETQIQDANERVDNIQEYGLNLGLQTKEGKMQFNPENGKLEKTYITPLGNKTTSKPLADIESFRYRQAADMSIGGQLRKANLRLQELKAKQAERASEVHKEWVEETEKNKAPLAAILGAATYTPRQQSDKENSTLRVAIRETEELIKNLEEQKDRENGVDVGFWRGFGRTMGDVRTWDFGMGDMADAMTMMNADKLKGDNATEGERESHDMMMGAIHEKQQAEERYGGNADFWNRAGVMTGYMPSFMLDFILTGGGFKGLSTFSKGSTKVAAKVIGKETAEKMAQQGFKSYIKENGVRGLGQYATDWTIKALGTTADDLLVHAPAMTNTIQAGKTVSDIIDRKLGDVVVDENGNYDFSNDKTWGSAIWQGEANAIIENYSEMFGAHLDPIFTLGNMSKLANVLGAKRLGGVLSKADAGALNSIMGQTHQMFNKMGVSDYVGEVSEEYYGQLWRTMLSLDDAYQQNPDGTRTNLFATGQFHGDIWGGMALSMGVMGAGKHTLSAANYASMKHGVNKADAKVNELLGKEVWEPLKATLDLTTNENIGEVAELVAGDKDFTADEKAAVLNYMERSLNLRGFNLASMARSRGGVQSESEQQANDSYLDGYNVTSSQEMNDAKNLYEYHRTQVADLADENMFAMIEENPIAALEFVNGNEQWSDEDKSSVIDYINAKQVYNGMIQRVRDDIDGRVEQSNSMIDARVNRKTGMIQGATMKQDERKVYVLSGTLVPYADGSGVSVTDSDNSIIVRDADTGGLEQVSPDAILSIDDVQDPYEQKELVAQSIREQFAREAADKIDGVVTFNPGETYTIAGEGGSQIQVTIVSDENGIIDNGDGTINVTDGTNVFPIAKEAIQQFVDASNIARIAEFEQQRAEENLALQQEEQEADRPQYAMNDLVMLRDENGIGIRGNITADVDADGLYEVYTEDALNGKRVNMFTREELDSMLIEHNGQLVEIADSSVNDNSEVAESSLGEQQLQASVLERIPKDEQGNPIYEQAETPDVAWDAIVEQTEGDEAMAQSVADGMVADKEAVLKKVEKTKSAGGNTIAEKIAAEKERKAAIDAAKQELSIWQKIAGTANRRKMEADAERRRIADEAAALRKAEEEKLRAEREEAERKEREALNGVPDIVEDVPKDARARGYRRVNGHKVDRQEPLQAVQGKEVNVKFSNDVVAPGNVTVIDASLLQPSHIQGVRNPLHFIDEAQPKERNDEASVLSARKIAENIRPEEITSGITAYTGAPTVNERGEVIQGNNRSDALRLMWESHSEQAEAYRQYLKDHAEEFGLRAEDIAPIQSPVLVNMLHVDDTEALNLGQFVAQDTESGGVERIKPKNTLQRMGTEMRSFANLLLRTSDDEMSFAGLVDANGANVLKWMSQRGFISHTQYKSAFDSKGNLTPESKNDLRGIMYQSIFKDGSTRLEEMFNVLPVKAQKAILATAFRDYDSSNSERMVDEIQNSVRAYYALSQDKMFAEAKNFKEARIAVENWKRQYQMDDVTGESYLPADNFSNFVLHLAAMYKGESQSFIQNTFGKIYDLIQGTQEETLFEQPDNTPRTLVQAIKEALNLDYNGQQRSNVLVGDTATSQRGQQGSNGALTPRERVEDGNGTTDDTGRTESIGEQSEIEPSLSQEEMLSSDDTDNQLSAKIARRIEVQEDDWVESGKYGDTYKQTIIVDGTHKVIKVDAPDTKGNYTGSTYEYDGQTFGDLLDVVNYIDASSSLANAVAVAEKETDTTPTEKQKEAGNYKKGHVQVGTFNITIENPKGSVRSGIDTEGNKWETTMQNTYGYIRGTEGVDGDHIDVFLSDDIDGWNGRKVFVVDQYNEDGTFDEHKVMLGFNEADAAEAAYFANYDRNWAKKHKTVLTGVNLEEFEKWIESSHRKTKAFSEYKSVKTIEGQSSGTQGNRLSEVKFRIEELHKEQEAAHNRSDIFDEARIISEINDLFTEQRKLEQDASSEEATAPTDAPYTITPAQYITKRGKVLDMQLVEFPSELRKEVQKHVSMFAKEMKGWWDREKHGFMMRSEEDAKRLAEYAVDAQGQPPISMLDIQAVNDGDVLFTEPKAPAKDEKQDYTPVWQYSVSVDKETGYTTLTRDDVSGPIPIGDARFRQTTNSPEEMLGILRNPQNGMQEVLDAVGVPLENKIKTRELDRKAKDEIHDKRTDFVVDKEMDNRYSVRTLMKMIDAEKQAVMDLGEKRGGDVYHEGNIIFLTKDSADKFANEARTLISDMRSKQQQGNSQKKTEASGNRLVTDERYAELRERMRKKLLGQMNIGIDPEILAIGTEMAVYHLEKGSRKFAEYAKAMIVDLGDSIRPYLKAFYNGARDLPEVLENGLNTDMTSYDEVQKFDVANFDKSGIDALATAETVTKEAEVAGEVEVAQERIKKTRSTRKKSEKKTVNLQQSNELGLFGSLFDNNETNNEDGRIHQESTKITGTQREVNSENGAGGTDRRSMLPPQSGNARSTVHMERGRVDGDLQRGRDDGRGNRRVQEGTGEIQRGRGTRLSDDAIDEPKNTRNNHSDRGTNYAPTSVDARIEANIKAIELAQQLIESGELATPKQMAVLRKFSGWGGLGKVFSDNTYSTRLQQLMGTEAYQEAVMSANSAYYTPAYVVDTLWDIVTQMGFKGGYILEGSAGIGNILGQMPTNISEHSDIHAIEIDGTSGGILSLLYPDAKVEIQGFEQTRIPNGSVDLAITNVPFVTGLRVNDTTGDKDLSKKFHNIHDFCIAKNVRKLREGGLGIFITSNGTLDNSKKLRDWIVGEGGADFVGAFRMHNKTFGGTGVTSDIVVIRKRVNGQKSVHAIDVSDVSGERMAEYDTGETRKVKGKEIPVIKQLSMDYNRYFIEHPENMAGEMHFAFEKGDTFRPTSKGLYPKQNKKQEEMLAEFVRSFRAEEFGERNTELAIDVMPGKKIGEVFVKDGKLYINSTASAQPLEVNANKVKGHTKVECFEAYTAIKEALAEVLSYQTANESDEGLKPLLDKLNKVYDDFVGTYGHFNKNTAIAFLRNDVDYANVYALEKFEETADEKGNQIQKFDKTDVFSKRVVEKEKEPTPTNVKDGIIASIFKFGRVDIPYIAEQLGTGIEDVKKEIIESGYGFENPVTRQMEASYHYLSGNIREKLRQAEVNNENGEFDRNIKALQEVMPMEIPAHLIDFTLGSSWIDPKLYEDFVKERTEVDVRFTAVGGTWFMKEPYFTDYEKNRAMGVTSEMLNRTIMGHTLIEAAIQNRSITVSTTKKHYDGTTETITDKEATQACAAKIDEIRQDFKDWARQKMQSDPEMSALIERIYNDTFNNFVPMSIPDEFVPEYFGGASHKFKMRPHQGRAIIRGTQQPLLLAHEVGTGKTFTLISTAMEMRRLGTARKPMIVVQNATVGQFVASAKELYPNAKILTLEEADRSAEGRKNFYAKIRYNDWDMIVIPQSTFEFIPDSEEREMTFVQDKIEEKMLILEKMKEEDPDGKNMITRQAEREIELLEEQLAGLADNASKKRTANDEKKRAVALQNAEVKAMEMLDRRTDDVENFDDMGIDALLVDEAHEYKHLGFATAMQRGVKGVDPSYSKKSQGVFLKTQAILEKNNGRNVIFATGTPISNTAAEIWTFMRYLMPADTMKEYGIYYFDDFVRNFGNIQQMLEFTTSGKFKENNRFAGYVNLPELVRIWSGVSDTVLTKEAGGVKDKIPEMEGGKAQDLYLPQTRALRSIMKFVKNELEHYEQMSGKEKKENSHIPLTMYGIAKAAAVDARLVQSDAEDDVNSKTHEAVRQTLRSLKETADYKGTVAIFADNYQNKQSGFNLYDDIRDKLITEGVPADEIVIMRSGMTVKKKLEIFEKVNRGEVRVILGSTFTLGTGVNIQERLHTLIHLDAPNRPMDYTQRNGRILRQGNLHKDMNKPVRILRFGVEDSLDVTAYQRLKTKGAIADSIMNGKQMMSNSMTNRVLEEEEDVFGDTIAQLSGSEYAMLKNNAEKNVRKYASRKKQWETDQAYIHNAKPRLKAFIKDAEKRIEDNSRSLEAVRVSFPDEQFKEIIIGKHRFTSVDTMDDFFKEHNKTVLAEMKQMKDGDISGEQKRELTIQIGNFPFIVSTKLTRQTMRDGTTLFNDVERKMTYSCTELGIEDVPVRQNLLRNAIEDITGNVITGKNFTERLEAAERSKKHNEAELKELLSREGKPFEYEEELAQAKSQLEEYAELMKKELEEKEAKYAEMDATVETANNVSTSEEDDELKREDDGAYTDDEVSYDNDSVAKLLGQSRRTAKQRRKFAQRERQRMAERVVSLTEKLHLDNVEVVTDASTLDGKKQRAKGFYSKSTGKITIVIPNHTSMFDVEQTLLHEAVAHYGLRQLFGEHFDTFLDNVFNNADEIIRRRIVDMASKNGWDFRKATEEYLAGLAEHINFEEARKNGWWQRIKQFFFEMLDKLGFSDFRGVTLTDNELRYILWRSYENLKEGKHSNLFEEAADIAMQHKLRVGEFADTSTDDVLNRDGDPEIHERTLARAKYEQRVKSGMYQSQEALQDSMLGLKEAMTAILGKNTRMEDVDGFENAYLGENRLSSVNKAEADAFAHLLFKPMLEEVAKLAHNTAEREELTDYMMAKHGLERNRVMAERDAQKDFAEYQKQHPKSTKALQDFIDECRKRDYAGLTALTGMEEIVDAEAEAQVMVDEYENAHDTTALWSKVNAVSKAVLSKSYECGMMSKETYDSVRDMYEFYIPLRGFDEKTSSEAYAYLTHKQSLFNAPIKKAEGRRSKADDPFANLQSMAESAIMQGNRNKLVKQKFLNFALNHPSDLVSVSDLWLQYDAVADEWKPIFPDNIDINDSPEEVERKMNEFEDKMKQLAESAPDNYKHGKDAVNIPYRVVENRNLRQHQVVVKRNGRDYVITINGNPRAAQALNGQTNPDNDISGSIGQLVHLIGDVNRTLSSLYTTLQPDFIASNFLRDMVYSNSMVWVKESPKYAIQYNMNFAKLPIVRMVMLLDKYRRGTLDMNDEIEKMFYQFMMNGGETGFSRMADIDEHKKEIKKMLKAANEKIPAHVVRECMATWIGEVGRGIEMRARFAAFVTSRNAGRTIDRSIWDAKEISVNFNKKGAGDKFLGAEGQTMLGNVAAGVSGAGRAGYIFWNAALQGTFGNFLKYAMRHPGKMGTVVASWYGLAMLVTALASAGGDDDDDSYYDIPEHTRRQNLIVKGPGNAWIKIPLPIEYRAVYAMGELTGSSLFHNEKLEVSDVLAQMSQLLPVDMMEGTKALWPSSVKPMVEVSNNESWYGSPIWKDTPYNKYMPNWTKAYKSANKDLVNLSETLNEVSGGSKYRKGTIDLNPAAIEYLLKQYTGGFFTVTNQIRNLINVGTGEKDFDWRYVPLANRMLMSGGDERNVGRGLDEKFFGYLDAYRAKASEFSAIKGDLSLPLEKKAELISEIIIDPEYVKMKGMERIYSKLKKAYDTAKEIGDTSKAEELEKRINELKRKFILEMEQDERK